MAAAAPAEHYQKQFWGEECSETLQILSHASSSYYYPEERRGKEDGGRGYPIAAHLDLGSQVLHWQWLLPRFVLLLCGDVPHSHSVQLAMGVHPPVVVLANLRVAGQ